MNTRTADNRPDRLRNGHLKLSSHQPDPQPRLSIDGSRYRVDFGVRSPLRYHLVDKNRECSCGAKYCEAIEVVRRYLMAGGLRAPDLEGMPSCPICGSKTYREHTWDGMYTHALGWRCAKGGLAHFLTAKANQIRRQQAANPWLIPPVDGYPGVRRDEVLTWEDCQASDRFSDLEDYTI